MTTAHSDPNRPRRLPTVGQALAVAMAVTTLAVFALVFRGPVSALEPMTTIQDVMHDEVGPAAEVLWTAVTTVSTPQGIKEKAPETDADWERLEQSTAALLNASKQLLDEERPVAPPGTKSATPGVELEPEQIAALLDQDRETWTRLVHELEDTAELYARSIEQKSAAELLDDGDALNTACENCHEVFWYPEEMPQ